VVPIGTRINELADRLALPAASPSDPALAAALAAGPGSVADLVDARWTEALAAGARTRLEEVVDAYARLVRDVVARGERGGPPDPSLVAPGFREKRKHNPYFDDMSDFGLRYAAADEAMEKS
jgi:hypothetical protein